MNYQEILLEKSGNLALVTLNRPESLNPLSEKLADELIGAFQEVEDDTSIRVAILTGAGRGFCAGGDVKRLLGSYTDRESERIMIRKFNRLVVLMRQLDKPIIAAVNGVAAGGGASLAVACDIVLAADDARMGFVFPQIGLSSADLGATYFVPRLVGLAKATELLLTGDLISTKEAEAIGLINRTVPADSLMAEAKNLAQRIAGRPPLATMATKLAINKGLSLDLVTDLEYEAYLQAFCMSTEDHLEGLNSFREKRIPQYKCR